MARMEYRYDAAHPAYAELERDAAAMGISLQALIHLLLVARHQLRHGQRGAHAALWVPEGEAAPAPPEHVPDGAALIADEWL